MYTGMYKSPDNIDNFKIRVKLKESRTTFIDDFSDRNFTEEIVISWQEKLFSENEIEKYMDEKNCKTELEKQYYETLKNGNINNQRIFTYCNDDDYFPSKENITKKKRSIFAKKSKTPFKDKEEPYPYNNFQRMFIMADLKYAKGLTDNNLIEVKKEIMLCEIKWDPNRSSIFIYPDFSKNDPYMLEIDDDSRNIYYYWIENASEEVSDAIRFKEFQLIQDLRKRQALLKTKDIQKTQFDNPPNNEIHFHIFIEILRAYYFEADNLFIQYYIDLPENWRIHDDDKFKLSGVTQSARTHTLGTNNKYNIYDSVAMFGYPFQLTFIYNYKNFDQSLGLLHCPTIYFEIISKDTWSRYRTEGYAYKTIPINQFGIQYCNLECIYVKPRSRWGELHHFFIGGCSALDDITWLGTPTNHQEDMTINKFGVITVGTGMIEIKFQVLHHSQAFIKSNQQSSSEQTKDHFLHTYSVIKSINEVLKAFKKARDQMNEARKTLY